MKSRLVASLALGGLAAAAFAGCGAGERFSPECEAGTVRQGDGCVKPAATAGAAGAGGGSAGAGGAGTGGAGTGGTAGVGGGDAGSGGAGGAGSGGAGSSGTGAGGAGTGGAGAGGAGSGGTGIGGGGAGSSGVGTGGAGTGGAGGMAGTAGSGGATIEEVLWKSGSRLRAYVRDLGGFKAFGGWEEGISLGSTPVWRDTKLNLDCRFLVAADGSTRCLPGVGIYFTNPPPANAFVDAGCSQPAVLITPPCGGSTMPPPAYEVVWIPGCGQAQAVFGIGDALLTDTYYVKSAGGCTAAKAPGTVRVRGKEVDPALFVKASEAIEPGGGLSQRVWLGEDGSRQVFGAYDPQRKEACLREDVDGTRRCIPRRGFANASSSPLCAQLDLLEIPITPACPSPQPPTHASYLKYSGGTQFLAYAKVGAQTAVPTVYYPTGTGTCKAVSSKSSLFWEIGDDVAAATFPAYDIKPVGSSAVKINLLTNGGRTFVSDAGKPTDAYTDVASGKQCLPTKLGDGKTYCVANQWISATLSSTKLAMVFADAACTQPCSDAVNIGPANPPPVFTAIVQTNVDQCSSKKVYALGKKVDKPYTVDGLGGCNPTLGYAYELGAGITPPWTEVPLSVE